MEAERARPGEAPRSWRAIAASGLRTLARRFSRSAQNREILTLLHTVIARQREEMTALRASRSAHEKELTMLREQLRAQGKDEAKWRSIFRGQLDALVRRDAVHGTDIAQPYALDAQRFRLRSQNEEDGITLALLKSAGITNRRFVEIGSGSSGGNSAILAFEFGWTGLMVEASKGKAETLRRAIAFNQDVTVVQKRVTPDTFNGLLERYGCAGEVDFMSIDIDSVDYWLLDVLRVCSPRVLVIEYNALFGRERALTLPATGLPAKAPKGYFGASLTALARKAGEKGYRLVYCDERGVNAFFLREGVAPAIAGLPPAVAFRPMRDRLDIDGSQKEIDIFAVIEAQGLPIVEV